jgi:hypothetical protein
MIPVIPVKKADIPEIPARGTGIVSKRPLINVCLSRSPEATKNWIDMNNTMEAIAKPIDHLPRRVLGMK